MTPPPPSPSNDDLEELLLSCRYGELDEVKSFVERFGRDAVATVRDENGNTVLHMACGNGHNGKLPFELFARCLPFILIESCDSQRCSTIS